MLEFVCLIYCLSLRIWLDNKLSVLFMIYCFILVSLFYFI